MSSSQAEAYRKYYARQVGGFNIGGILNVLRFIGPLAAGARSAVQAGEQGVPMKDALKSQIIPTLRAMRNAVTGNTQTGGGTRSSLFSDVQGVPFGEAPRSNVYKRKRRRSARGGKNRAKRLKL